MDRLKLQEMGGLVSDQPVERTVTWVRPDGESFTFDVLIRQLPFADFEDFTSSDKSDMQKMFGFLAKTIMFDSEDGPVPMSLDEVKRLHQGLVMVLVEAAQQVNGLGEGKP